MSVWVFIAEMWVTVAIQAMSAMPLDPSRVTSGRLVEGRADAMGATAPSDGPRSDPSELRAEEVTISLAADGRLFVREAAGKPRLVSPAERTAFFARLAQSRATAVLELSDLAFLKLREELSARRIAVAYDTTALHARPAPGGQE